MVILFVLCTVGMIYVGGFFGVDAWGGTECAGDFIGAPRMTPSTNTSAPRALVMLLRLTARVRMVMGGTMAMKPLGTQAMASLKVSARRATGVSGIELFIRAIPYNFYSLLTFVFIIGLAVMKFDYGPK